MIPAKVRRLGAAFAVAALATLSACERSTNRPPAQPGPGQWQGPGYPQPQPYPGPGYPPGPGQQVPPPGTQPPPGPPVQNDPINAVDIGWMRQRSSQVLNELVQALPPAQSAKVVGIPLINDPTVGEVNAYAACDRNRVAAMGITDGLLDVAAHLAQFRATDEVFGTRKLDAYIQLIAKNQKPKQPIVRPPAGMIDPAQHADPRKVARQGVLFDEELAFVLGHELAHHYLGHTGCANGSGGGINPADIGRLLSGAVPLFNQPNEVSSDIFGTHNLMTAGARRGGTRWNEGGSMLVLNFFAGLDQLTPADIIFGFERSHPPPTLRIPIVQQTAQNWRASGGAPPMLPPF